MSVVMTGLNRARGFERTGVSDFVAGRVRAARKRAGLNQRDLDEALASAGFSAPIGYIANVETGRRRIDVEALVALALVLDVEPGSLLPGAYATDRPSVPLDELRAFLSAFEVTR